MQILLALVLGVLVVAFTIKLACMLFKLVFRLLVWFVKLAFVVVCVLGLAYLGTYLLFGY